MTLQERKRARRLSINNRELLFAATNGDLERIKKLMRDGADINFMDRDGNTPLHWAVETGNKKIVDFLVTNGASTKQKNSQGETPIDIGKRIQRQDIAKILDPPSPLKPSATNLPENPPKKVSEVELNQITPDISKRIQQEDSVKILNPLPLSKASPTHQLENLPKKASDAQLNQTTVKTEKCIEQQDSVKILNPSPLSKPSPTHQLKNLPQKASETQLNQTTVKIEKCVQRQDSDKILDLRASLPKTSATHQPENLPKRDSEAQMNQTTADIKNFDPSSPLKSSRKSGSLRRKVFQLQLNHGFGSNDKISKITDACANVENMEEKRLNNPVHGHIYQLKVLMLFLYRGIAHKYSFRLGSEIKDAKKFDDLVFEYTKGNQKMYRLLQAKHKLDESKKITADDLLFINNGDYNLIKYFLSYLQSKKAELFKDGLIEDVTICTNIDFDMKSLESYQIGVEEVMDADQISDVKSDRKKPIRYKFDKNVIKLLKSALENYRSPKLTKIVEYSDEDIRDFLNRLIFAVNQPNEEELGCIVKEEISKEFDFFTEDVYNKFFITMLDWLQGKGKALFLSSEDGKKFFDEMNKGVQFWFDVKPPSDSFTGRSKKLKDLHKLLKKKEKFGASQIVCITGLGGVGKSELAKKYISLYSQEYDNKVVWVNAESYESLAKSFRRLACDQLRISLKNADNEEKKIVSVVEDVYRFFSQRKCLLVFDNAEKYKSHSEYDNGIDRFLPADRRQTYVLITSRNQNWPTNTRVMSLSVFDKVEAVEFLKYSLDIRNPETEVDITDIANELQCLPLALQQAVAYIKKQSEKMKNVGLVFKINEYLEKYQSKTKIFLNSEFSEDNDNDYAKTIFSTWNVTLDAIRKKENGALACEILEMLSFFASSDIPVNTIINLANSDIELASDAVQLLKQYSMIYVENKIIYLHRLVQQVTRLHVQDEKREEDILFKALSSFDKSNLNLENVEHAISLWNYATKYENLLIEYYYFPSYISSKLLKYARYEETRLFAIKVSELLRNLPSRDLRILLGIMAMKNNIGQALLEQGKYDTALKEFRTVLAVQEHYLGADHPENTAIKNNIALALVTQGKYEMALEMYYEILEFEKKTKGKTHTDTLLVKYDLGTVLISQGKYKEALKMLQDVLHHQEIMLGHDDNKTLKTKNSIAAILFHLKSYDEALKIYKETLSINEKVLPKHHPDVLATKSNIAGIFLKQGEYNKALEIFVEAYEITTEAFGELHPDGLSCRRHIAEILRGQGKVAESLKIYEEVLSHQMQILGGNHPETINTQYSIAQVLHRDHKNYNEALTAYEVLLQKCRIILGDKNYLTLRIQMDLAEILMEQKNFQQAQQYYEHVYQIRKENLGEDHPDTVCTLNSIGMSYQYQNKSEEALKLFRECYKKLHDSVPDHPDIMYLKHNISHVLFNQRKYEEALPILREILKYQESTLGKNHPSSASIKNKIAIILMSKENPNILDVIYPRTLKMNNTIRTVSSITKDLLTSVKKNDSETLKNLLNSGGDVNSADEDGITLLHYAINNGNLNIVKILLEKKADATKVSKKGNTPLHVATLKNHKQILEMILKHANTEKLYEFVNAKTTTGGATALHVAAKNGSLDFVRILLKHNAIHNILNHKNETPLHVSTHKNVDRLLQLIQGFFKDAQNGDAEFLDKLNTMEPEELPAILNARDLRGNTLLQVSIINKHKSIASGLLKFIKK